MKYGNCLIGLIIILFTTKTKGHVKAIFRKNSWIPHLMYVTNENKLHYKLKKDILPYPLCYLLFEGEFVSE